MFVSQLLLLLAEVLQLSLVLPSFVVRQCSVAHSDFVVHTHSVLHSDFQRLLSIARFISITLILKIWYINIIYIINHIRKAIICLLITICSLYCLISISSLHIGLQIVKKNNQFHFSLTRFNVLNVIHSAIHYHFLYYPRTCPRTIKLHTSSMPCSVVIVKNVITHFITTVSGTSVISALLNLTCFPKVLLSDCKGIIHFTLQLPGEFCDARS